MDPYVLTDLRNRKEQLDQIKQHASLFSIKQTYNEKDLKTIYTLLQQARQFGFDFYEKKNLLNILKSFVWFSKLHFFIQDADPEKSNTMTCLDKNDVTSLFNTNLDSNIAKSTLNSKIQ